MNRFDCLGHPRMSLAQWKHLHRLVADLVLEHDRPYKWNYHLSDSEFDQQEFFDRINAVISLLEEMRCRYPGR